VDGRYSTRPLEKQPAVTRLPSDEVIGPDERDPLSEEQELADFTMRWDTVRLVPLAVVVGVLSAAVALLLLKLIALATSLAYFHEWSTSHDSPAGHSLGWTAIFVPIVGGLIVGLMARFGSERQGSWHTGSDGDDLGGREQGATAYPDETLRDVADRMAAEQVGVLPVVRRGAPDQLQGIITQFDLLAAQQRILDEERHRERVLSVTPLPRLGRRRRT
jgi:CBS domain-containing protein